MNQPRLRTRRQRADTRAVTILLIAAAVFVAMGLILNNARLGLVMAILMAIVATGVGVASRRRPGGTPVSDEHGAP